ncbi:MAG: cytochrome c family protein [Gammaproteobacteria bacterium]|nr:cytochrome c family protein [Gammaproteobacteria bacterium]
MILKTRNLALLCLCFLFTYNGLAKDNDSISACVNKTPEGHSKAIPPLRKALGEAAFNDAMKSGKYVYTGNTKCRLCHRDFFIGRKKDAHDHSYEKLVANLPQYADNPDCLNCHTTGHGINSGFVNMKRTARLANVQCEGCHGPGSEHIKRQVTNMSIGGIAKIDKQSKVKAGGFLAGTDKPDLLKKMCKSCHIKRWSQSNNNFEKDYDSYKLAKPEKQK